MKEALKARLRAVPLAYRAARWLYGAPGRARQAAEHLYVDLRFRHGEHQSVRWNHLLITERRGDPYVGDIVFGRMIAFEAQQEILRRLIVGSRPVALDVGANIGMVSLLMSQIPGITVYAFEPVAITYGFLLQNLEQNGIRNVVPVNGGLSDAEAELALGIPTSAQHPAYARRPSSGLFSVHASEGGLGPKARFTTMDAFCAERGIARVDYVKIDVEGHELAVLGGGRSTLAAHRPICQIECNTASLAIAGRRPDELVELLAALSYGTFVYEGGRFAPCTGAELAAAGPNAVIDVFALPEGRSP